MLYAFSVELTMPFDRALEEVNRAIKEEGLGVVSEVDIQTVMRNKLKENVSPYRILGACAPSLAKQVIEADPEGGALLPCNIIVREIKPGVTGVTFMDPETVFGLSDVPEVAAAGAAAKKLVEGVRTRLTGEQSINLTE